MGKKNKKEKKGKGKEKTAQKTEKNAEKRAKKAVKEAGEDDVESLISQFEADAKRRTEVKEEKCSPPTPRCNMSLTAHPDRDELIIFGGELLTGKNTFVYNDLYLYNIKKNEWTKVTAPNAPAPRSSHQAVALRQDGGQLWVFGGEFSNPSQSQFYHYRDLYMYSFKEKTWTKISAPGGPSARSGHRMVHCKRQLLIFGGFRDNTRDFQYFNDLYSFNLDTYVWSKLDTSGRIPSPRSACQMTVLSSGNQVIVFGGYSKERVKKDVDKGTIHVDMYLLSPEGKSKEESAVQKWKWQIVKYHGEPPSPRTGMTWVVTHADKAYCFGGVHDQEDDDEDLTGVFYNDMYQLELPKGRWFPVILRGKNAKAKKDLEKRKRRRAAKMGKCVVGDAGEVSAEDSDISDDADEQNNVIDQTKEQIKKLRLSEVATISSKSESAVKVTSSEATYDHGVFKVTIGSVENSAASDKSEAVTRIETSPLFSPSPRMNACLVIRSNILYLYGGMCEEGDRQLTYNDLYALDLDKLDEWTTLIELDKEQLVWEVSDSSDADDDEDDDEDEDSDDDEDGLRCAKSLSRCDKMDSGDDQDDDSEDAEEDKMETS